MKTVRLALLGFGNAGQAFARLLNEKQEELISTLGTRVLVSAIATHRKGTILADGPEGLDLASLLQELEQRGRFPRDEGMTALQVAQEGDYDILVELTPLDIFSGEPAISHIKAGLNRGKSVITANKGPVAWAYRELKSLAAEKGALFLCETTVMDGSPVFNLVRETLPFCRVKEISGILNTTTNFILEEMEAGQSFEEALEEGRRRGFVEADPSADLEGWDAAAKVTALMNVLMDAGITPLQIDRQGIGGITEEQLKDAASRGKSIKLLCRGWMEDGVPHGKVGPEEVDRKSLMAVIDGTSSVVSIETDLMGKLSVLEHNPEIEQTAFGIFSDLIHLLKRQVNQ